MRKLLLILNDLASCDLCYHQWAYRWAKLITLPNIHFAFPVLQPHCKSVGTTVYTVSLLTSCDSMAFQQMLCLVTETSLGSANRLLIFFLLLKWGFWRNASTKGKKAAVTSWGKLAKWQLIYILFIHVVKITALSVFFLFMQINTSNVGWLYNTCKGKKAE